MDLTTRSSRRRGRAEASPVRRRPRTGSKSESEGPENVASPSSRSGGSSDVALFNPPTSSAPSMSSTTEDEIGSLVEPGDGAFDVPSDFADPHDAFRASFRDDRQNSPVPRRFSGFPGVVGLVGEDGIGASTSSIAQVASLMLPPVVSTASGRPFSVASHMVFGPRTSTPRPDEGPTREPLF